MTGAEDVEVAVLGAGSAGLTAAYLLARAGRSVTVLEASSGPGGLAASFDVAGIRVDHGSHRLHPSCDPELLALVRASLGDELQRRARNGRILLEGRTVAFPPRIGDLARRLPPSFAAGVARDALVGPFRRPRRDTFDEVVRASLGPTMATRFYEPYVEKLFGASPDRLSGELARRRVGASSLGKLVRKAVRGRDPDAGTFWYPAGGFGRIPEALAAAATGAGAVVRYDTPVRGIAVGREAVELDLGDGRVRAAGVLSTLPLALLARLVDDTPVPVLDAARMLRSRAIVLAYVVLPQARYTPFDAHYFPGDDVPFARVSEPKNYRDGADDPSDRTVLCAEFPCAVEDRRWRAEPDALAATVVAGLQRAGLPEVDVAAVEVRRLPRAYPIYDLGFETHHEVLRSWTDSLPRVLSFGRQGLFAHDNTHHAMATARAAVASLGSDGTVRREEWVSARRGFDAHVVED